MPEYFFILLFLLLLSIYLHNNYKIKLYKSKKQMILTNLVLLLVGTVWDQFAIFRGHWTFGEEYLLGIRIGFMPIEEFGFIFIMTYFVFILYKLIEKNFSK